MSVKLTVFVLWCVGTCSGHPAYLNDDHVSNSHPFPDNHPTDHIETLMVQNFDNPPSLTRSRINQREIPQLPIDFIPQSHSFHDNHVPLSGFGRPNQIPDDVELVNTIGKPVPFKPNFDEVELVWPGRPIGFSKDGPLLGIQRQLPHPPLMIARDGGPMMPMLVDNIHSHIVSHMMPVMIEKPGMGMPIIMEQGRMIHQEPPMLQMQREAHMMPMAIDRPASHLMPVMIQRENPQMMPVMMEREGPQIVHHERTDRFKRSEASTSNSMQSRTEIEKKFLSELDKTLDNVQKQNIALYPTEVRDEMAFPSNIQNDQSKPQLSINDLESQNEVKHGELLIMDKIMNDEQEKTTSAPFTTTVSLFDTINEIKNPQIGDTDKIMNDQQPQDTSLNADNQQTTTVSLFESINEIKNQNVDNTDKVMNDEQDNTSSNINDQQTTTVSLFDAINEIKNQQLAETDKATNDQYSQETTTTKDDQNQAVPTMSVFDAQNKIKDLELAAIDKLISNDQPSKEQPITTVATEKPTIGIFDSQDEVKDQNLAGIDKKQNDQSLPIAPSLNSNTFEKTTPVNVIAAEMEFDREIAIIDRLLKDDLAAIRKILNEPTSQPQNQAKNQSTSSDEFQNNKPPKSTSELTNDQINDKTPTSISNDESPAHKHLLYNSDSIPAGTAPSDLMVTQIIQEISYDLIDRVPSIDSNQTNSIQRKPEEVESRNADAAVPPTHPPTQQAKTPESFTLAQIQDLTRLLSGINQQIVSARNQMQHSPQNIDMLVYPQHYNSMGNYAVVQPMVIPSAENSQSQYRYLYPNYQTSFY